MGLLLFFRIGSTLWMDLLSPNRTPLFLGLPGQTPSGDLEAWPDDLLQRLEVCRKVTAGRFSVANVEIVPASQVKEGSSVLLVNPGEAAAEVEAFKALQGYLKAIGSIHGGSVRMASGGDFGAEGLLKNWKKMSTSDQAKTALLVSASLELAFHLIGSIKVVSGDPLETFSEIMQKFRPIDPSDSKAKQQIDEMWNILTEMKKGVNIGEEQKKPPPGTVVKLKNNDGLEGWS